MQCADITDNIRLTFIHLSPFPCIYTFCTTWAPVSVPAHDYNLLILILMGLFIRTTAAPPPFSFPAPSSPSLLVRQLVTLNKINKSDAFNDICYKSTMKKVLLVLLHQSFTVYIYIYIYICLNSIQDSTIYEALCKNTFHLFWTLVFTLYKPKDFFICLYFSLYTLHQKPL